MSFSITSTLPSTAVAACYFDWKQELSRDIAAGKTERTQHLLRNKLAKPD